MELLKKRQNQLNSNKKMAVIIGSIITLVITISLTSVQALEINSDFTFLEKDEETYDSIVIFRNDDVYSNTKEFEEINDLFEDRNVPITHGVVPHRILNENSDFEQECSEFRQLQRNLDIEVSYAAHGHDHADAEFLNTENDFDKLREIEHIFEACFGNNPKVFIPPDNLHKSNLKDYLGKFGYRVLSADRNGRWQKNEAKFNENFIQNIDREGAIIRLGRTQRYVDTWSPTNFKSEEEIIEKWQDSIENGEIIVQVLHYKPIMEHNYEEQLDNSIEYLKKEEDVKFMTFEGLYTKLEDNNIESTGDGWVVRS